MTLKARLSKLESATAPTARLGRFPWADLSDREREWVLKRLGAVPAASTPDPYAEELRALSDEELERRCAEAEAELIAQLKVELARAQHEPDKAAFKAFLEDVIRMGREAGALP